MAEEQSTEPTTAKQEQVDPVAEDMNVVEESAANGAKRTWEEEMTRKQGNIREKKGKLVASNEYEQMVLLDMLKKGHCESLRKRLALESKLSKSDIIQCGRVDASS
ncbi:hypothetical protein GH714_021750 [Hevea brasiliensis]|uniref:Uncharacterized protein n=1 Tax=Hevea brasiliensis TaxID=3981 RepID=A0A6A6MDK0_HEVBR|nr:hypothetical protein GH714_021750 [Hevea brasiliensis]